MGLFSTPSKDSDLIEIASLRLKLQEINSNNPDPSNWNLLERYELSGYCLLKIQYPNVKLHNGVKILLFKTSFDSLIKQKKIDPHFGEEKSDKLIYPIMRFAVGQWDEAKKIVGFLNKC